MAEESNHQAKVACCQDSAEECTWDASKIASLAARRGPSKLVGSYHNFDRTVAFHMGCMMAHRRWHFSNIR